MVLNGKGNANGINEDTQKRVWAKAKELNYKPNMMARSLRMGKSNTIGLIVADISNSFYGKFAGINYKRLVSTLQRLAIEAASLSSVSLLCKLIQV